MIGHERRLLLAVLNVLALSCSAETLFAATGFIVLHTAYELSERVLADAVRAKADILAAGQHYKFVLAPKTREAARNIDLPSLVEQLGRRHVSILAPEHASTIFSSETLEWMKETGSIGGSNFWESFEDLVPLMWYKTQADSLPEDVGFVWVLGPEVSWTGSLSQVLNSQWDPANIKAGQDFVGFDFVGFDLQQRASSWPHIYKHKWGSTAQIWSTLTGIMRYNKRLLEAVMKNMDHGFVQHGEITGATVCKLNLTQCRLDTRLNEDNEVVGRSVGGDVRFQWHVSIGQEEWRKIVANDADLNVSRLYYHVKW